MKKQSPYVNTGKQLNEKYNLLNEIKIVIDKLKLYKDNYLNEIECQQVLEGGIKNGRIR